MWILPIDKVTGTCREKVKIDAMEFGFMPGRGTTDAIFIVILSASLIHLVCCCASLATTSAPYQSMMWLCSVCQGGTATNQMDQIGTLD